MISFTPIFLIATSFLLLLEIPSFLEIAGIFIIVSGSNVLNLSSSPRRILDPFRAIMEDRGTAVMLAGGTVYCVITGTG